MRFRKRLGAAVLVIVMIVSSVQIPGGISYAAEPADGIVSGQDAPIPAVEETEEETGTAEGESQPDEGTVTDGGGRTDDEDAALGDDKQPGGDNAAGDDSQPGSDNAPDDDKQPDDDNAADDDDQPKQENGSEEETDAEQVSDNDAGELALSEDVEEAEPEETEMVEAEIEGAYQFGDAPEAGGGISAFSVSTYDNSLEDYLYRQMLKRADRIDISAYNLSPSDVGSLVSGVLNEHPDLYFVNRMFQYGYGPSYETVADLYMTYSTDYDDAAFKRKAEAALACVTDGMSSDMKAIVLHDYLVINVEYDYDNYLSGSIPDDSFNAYGTLVNGTAVCNGYALAYKYLLNQVGIESYMVTSKSMNHAWNLVKLDGEYYHVDTTWDDPVRDMVGRVYHDNLFRSDTNFGEHKDWTVTSGSSAVNYRATDSKYENAFWTDCDSPVVFDETDCYYVSNTAISLKKTSFSNFNAAGTDVVSVGRWGNWVGAFSGLYRINGRLFYNDGNSIYSINPDGTDRKTEFTPERTGSNLIYYSAYRNGKVVYALQTSPNLSEKQTVLTAEIEGVGEPETPPDPPDPPDPPEPPQKVGLDAENPYYLFTTLDDETVSSTADGKPKVLIIFKPDRGDCGATIQDLSEHIEVFSGADIYAIESFGPSTKAEVAEFKNIYGCDEITYCYDRDETNTNCAIAYIMTTGINSGNSIIMPGIIYIDSKNRVQHGTAGKRSWTQILTDLRDYCGYSYEEKPEEIYKIIYELNGGTNDSGNPTTYTSATETITLKDPSKEGFIFEGWYADARFNRKVTEIVKGSTGDITLYAKWKAAQVVIDPEQPETIRSGVYVRFTDYYRLGENARPCYKYTGAAIKPAVEVYNNGTLLTLGTDYTLAYKNNIKVGAASLNVKGKGSFSGASNAVSFEIINADIRTDTDHPIEMTVIAGTKVDPFIMNGAKKLTARDYSLEGSNLVDGKYAKPTGRTPNILTVKGIGSYAGSSFTIAVTVMDKKDAKKLAVTVDKNFKPVYDDRALDLDALFCSPGNTGGSIKVTDAKNKNTVLEKGKDFSVLCTSSLRDAGTVKFTVTGMGKYTGSVSKSFKISPLKVTDNSNFEVAFDNREYAYKAAGAAVDNLKVTYLGATSSADDDIVLTQGIDYKVSYANNKKVSTAAKKAQVKITFLGSYKGSKPVSKDFTIAAARMSMTTAGAQAANTKVIVPDKVYDKAGKSYKSAPIVMVDGAGIKASNYTVSYAWAAVTYAGAEGRYEDGDKVRLEEADSHAKVKVTITLKGPNYALADGTAAIEGEYCVRRKTEGVTDLSGAKVTFSDKDGKQLKALEYNGRAYFTPEGNNPGDSSAQTGPNAVYVNVTANGKTVDPSLYDVVWTNATAKGKATVVVTGKGAGAVGSRSQTISIKAMALTDRDIAYFMVNMANSLKNIL